MNIIILRDIEFEIVLMEKTGKKVEFIGILGTSNTSQILLVRNQKQPLSMNGVHPFVKITAPFKRKIDTDVIA